MNEGNSTRRSTTARWQWMGFGVLLIAIYLIPRMSGLDAIVTTDEPFWLGRSANFYSALWHGRPADTFQHAHPGVTTMWAGMVGYWATAPNYVGLYDTNLSSVYDIHERLRAMGLREMDVLIAARVAKVTLQAALFAIALIYLRRLFGGLIGLVAGTAIALDPFLIAHDRLLHVDGLVTIATFAAVLALADAVTGQRRRTGPWIIAGTLAALAWLTRATAVMLIGVTGVVLLADAMLDRTREPLPRGLIARVRPFVVWSAAALLTSLVLWPALWAAPGAALSYVVEWATGAAMTGHEHPIYFMGEVHYGDPGVLFYPVTVLWRMSILTSIGLPLFAITVAGPWRRRIPQAAWVAIGTVLLFAALYLTGMTLSAKKFDRYVLPLYPVLDLLAAIGLVTSAQQLIARRPTFHRNVLPALLGLTLLVQGIATNAARPHYLDTYTPLLGGTSAAADVMQLGWGEGISEAAEFIIESSGTHPGAQADEPPVVRISGGHAPLLYALPPPFVVEPNLFQTELDWQATDYYVATVQQWQRGIFSDVSDYLGAFEPEHRVVLNGVEYVRVWDLRDIPPPGWLTGGPACQWTLSNLRLENIETDDVGTITLWFRTMHLDDLPDRVTVEVELLPRSHLPSTPVNTSWSGALSPGPGHGWHSGVTLDVSPLAGDKIDSYLLRILLIDTINRAPLPAIAPGETTEQDAALAQPSCGYGQ